MTRMAPAALAAVALMPAAVWFASEAYTYMMQLPESRSYGRIMAILFFITAYTEYSLLSALSFQRRAAAQGCKPAKTYPHKDPILGLDLFKANLRAVKQNTLQDAFTQRFETLGNTYWNKLLGTSVLMTCEVENVKAILQSSFEDFPIGGPRLYALLPVLGPQSIFTSNGAAWKHSRNLIRPTFVRDQVADLECFDRHVGDLLGRIPRDGRTFDIQELVMGMTMDSGTDFMLGYSTNTLKDPSPRALDFVNAFELMNGLAAQRALLGPVMHLVPNREMDEAIKTSRSWVRYYMDRALAESKTQKRERSYVFFDELLKAGGSMEYIENQILSVIIAGRDTTAGAITACIHFLARHPEVVKKCRGEIADLGVDTPTWEQLKEMKYLGNVVKESLRLFPPVPTNSRLTAKELVLPRGGGPDGQSPLLLPKGTPVRYSTYAMHRRKDIYGPDADAFRPERWDDLRTSWEYLPFSGGPRICIGQQFALTQMQFTLFRLLQNFKTIESREPEGPMLLRTSTTIAFAEGCLVGVTPA